MAKLQMIQINGVDDLVSEDDALSASPIARTRHPQYEAFRKVKGQAE